MKEYNDGQKYSPKQLKIKSYIQQNEYEHERHMDETKQSQKQNSSGK